MGCLPEDRGGWWVRGRECWKEGDGGWKSPFAMPLVRLCFGVYMIEGGRGFLRSNLEFFIFYLCIYLVLSLLRRLRVDWKYISEGLVETQSWVDWLVSWLVVWIPAGRRGWEVQRGEGRGSVADPRCVHVCAVGCAV